MLFLSPQLTHNHPGDQFQCDEHPTRDPAKPGGHLPNTDRGLTHHFARLSVHGKCMFGFLIIIVNHPYGKQDIIRMFFLGVDLFAFISDGGIAGNGGADIGICIFFDLLFHPGQKVLIIIIVFFCNVSRKIRHFKFFKRP